MSLKNSWLLACSCGVVWTFRTSPCTASILSVSMLVGRRTHPASFPAPPTTTKALHKSKFHYPGTFHSTHLLMAYGQSTNFVVKVTGWKVWYNGSHQLWQPLKTLIHVVICSLTYALEQMPNVPIFIQLCIFTGSFTYVTHSHQLSHNSEPAKAASGGLSGCFQIFAKLKSISIKLWCVCTDMLWCKLNQYDKTHFIHPTQHQFCSF